MPISLGGAQEDPVPRRRGRTIGTFIIGACVLLLFVHALFGERFRWHPHGLPGNTDFFFAEGAVRLSLSVAELGATPKAMTEDRASD